MALPSFVTFVHSAFFHDRLASHSNGAMLVRKIHNNLLSYIFLFEKLSAVRVTPILVKMKLIFLTRQWCNLFFPYIFPTLFVKYNIYSFKCFKHSFVNVSVWNIDFFSPYNVVIVFPYAYRFYSNYFNFIYNGIINVLQ